MTAEGAGDLESLFHDALLRAPHERTAFLAQACAGDEALRLEVQALLDAHDVAPSYLEEPGFRLESEATSQAGGTELVGQRIGSYRIVRVIASGGMGTVYEAEQDHPRRSVAIKALTAGTTSPAMLRRFEYESQILAYLRHPGIGQVYDAGTFDHRGRSAPFFAMEFVPNARTITEYAKSTRLLRRQLLELFVVVCDAVHSAHQKGVIHRDLKPGNILVDSEGRPKVIDFGVARVTRSDPSITTVAAEVRALIGTLHYMSPEQCDADPRELDVRTDVYSLGVVLYEMLSGRLPHQLDTTSILQAVRIIREQPPTRLSHLDPNLCGDLELIVHTAIHPDRAKRYRSAAVLAEDIRALLANQPIAARPASALYTMRKFAARHRAFAAGVTVGALGLVVGAGAAGWQAVMATRQRDRAVEAERRASVEAKKVTQINEFLQRMLELANPLHARQEVTMREMLDSAAARIERDIEQPEVAASLRQTMGAAYRELGQMEKAQEHLQAAVDFAASQGPDTEAALSSALDELAELRRQEGRQEEAVELCENSLAIRRRLFGERSAETFQTTVLMGKALYEIGNYDRAQTVLLEAEAIGLANFGPLDNQTASAFNNLALLMKVKGNLPEAERYHRSALAAKRAHLGPIHAEVGMTIDNLARVVRARDPVEAVAFYEEAIRIYRSIFDSDHEYLASSMNDLAVLLVEAGRLDEAELLAVEALAMRERLHRGPHWHVSASMQTVASVHLARSKPEEAEPLLRRAVEMQRGLVPADHDWLIAVAQSEWGDCLSRLGRLEEAETVLRQAYESISTARGSGDKRTKLVGERLLRTMDARGSVEDAAAVRAALGTASAATPTGPH